MPPKLKVTTSMIFCRLRRWNAMTTAVGSEAVIISVTILKIAVEYLDL